ncbi:retrovirus-related pol polyprotein from transposon TNT 1-94, partial [Tanacetum coccineum]
KPTNNNLRTSSNTSRANQDNSPRTNRGTGYDNQRAVNVAGARETVGTQVAHQYGIQCYNCKEFRHVARECQKPKRAKDVAYHKEKTLLCKQQEAGIQLSAEQVDWRDDTDDEPKDQELEAHYLYMANIQDVTLDAAGNSRPIFDAEPSQKVQNDDDNYNVTNGEKADQDDDDLARECDLLASLIEKLKYEIDDSKKQMKKELIAHQETISIMSQEKEAQKMFYKTREDEELEKFIALENKIKVLDDIVYKTGQSIQTMNMLNRNCKTSFVKPEFLKIVQRANPRLYDIGCYNDNLALMLAPASDETIRLAKKVDQN